MPEAPQATPPRSCPLCGAGAQPWLRKRGFEVFHCLSCGCGFLPPSEVPDDLEGLYSRAYFEGGEETGYPGYLDDAGLVERNFSDRLARIERFCSPGRLLDVGAAFGLLLAVAARRGWDPIGVEIAADCAAEARRRTGRPVLAGDFLEAPLEGPFDVVTFFDVIEHMRDPAACIRRAADLLAPGGWLIVETGDRASLWAQLLGRAWYFVDPPQHIFYFSRKGIDRLVRDCGLMGPLRYRRMGRRVSLSNAVFKTAGVAGIPRGPLRRFSGLRLHAYVNFGDALIVAARRS